MESLDQYYSYSSFPSHIITKILSYLDWHDFKNAIQTCQTYYHASYDATITRRICLVVNPNLKNISYIDRPFSQLKLYNINFNKFDYISFFIKFGRYIKMIILCGCNISLVQLLEIFIFLINLNEVKMYPKTETFNLDYFVVSELVSLNTSKISTNLSHIRKLVLQSHSCNFRGLEKILVHTIKINTLIFNCYWDFNFNALDLFRIIKGWNPNEMKHLEINYLQNSNEQCSEFFREFSKLQQNNLIYLQLNDLSNLYHDKYFTNFCINHSKLEVLKIQQCNEKEMMDICRYMKSLRILVLGGLRTFSSLKEIGNLSKLEKLHLYEDNKLLLRNHVVQELFEINLKYLTSLDISFPVTKLNLITLCSQFQQLQHLKLRKLQTTYCCPIFKNLVNLKSLLIYFDDTAKPSTTILSEDVNISNLRLLENLEISAYTFGMMPEHIEQLSKLRDHYFLQDNKVLTRMCEVK